MSGRPSLRALFVAAVFAAQVVAISGAANHEIVPTSEPDLRIVDIYVTGDRVGKWFVNSNTPVTTWVNITNDGNKEVSDFVIDVRQVSTGVLLTCPRVTGVVAAGATVKVWVNWTMPTVSGGSDSHEIRYMANAYPTGAPSQMHTCSSVQRHETGFPPTQADPYSDNFGSLKFAVGRTPDLKLAPATTGTGGVTMLWCIGAAHPYRAGTGSCISSFTNSTSYVETDRTYLGLKVQNGDSGQSGIYMAGSTILKLPNATTHHENVSVNVTATSHADGQIFYLSNVTHDWTGIVSTCGPREADGNCRNFNLFKKAGWYTVRAEIDPLRKYPDPDRSNNVIVRDIFVSRVELNGTVDTRFLHVDPDGPGGRPVPAIGADPSGIPILPASGEIILQARIYNSGNVAANRGKPVAYSVYLMNPKAGEASRAIFSDSVASLAAGAMKQITVGYNFSADPNQGTYIRGGRIDVRLVIDDPTIGGTTGGDYTEECEFASDTLARCARYLNVVEAPIKITDTVKPELVKWEIKYHNETDVNVTKVTSPVEVIKKQRIELIATVKDNDEGLATSSGVVHANVTHATAPRQRLAFSPAGKDADGNFVFRHVLTNGLTAVGNHTVELEVTDTFGLHPVVTPAARTIAIRQWGIQTRAEDTTDCTDTCNPAKIWIQKPPLSEERGDGFYRWRINVTHVDTGIPNAKVDGGVPANSVPTQKKWITIIDPAGTKVVNKELLTRVGRCKHVEVVGQPCTSFEEETTYRRTQSGMTMLGVWQSYIEIEDKAGDVRRLDWNFVVRDRFPSLVEFHELPDAVDARTPIDLQVTLKDDTGPLGVAYANFTHRKGGVVDHTFNVTLPRVGACGPTGDGNTSCVYRRIVTTGWDNGLKELPLAGVWKLQVAFNESGGAKQWNWVERDITVRDTQVPRLTRVDASVREEEAGLPVRWNVTASDETKFHVNLTVVEAGTNQIVLNQVPMSAPNSLGESSFVRAFTDVGDYEWFVTVTDSAGNVRRQDTRQPLSILTNTAPRFAVLSPGPHLLVNGKYFAPSRPQVEILAYDNDGVDRGSLKVLVGDSIASLVDRTAEAWVRVSANPPGFIIRYNHTRAESNGAELVIRVAASDKSSPVQDGSGTFTLLIDNRAPETDEPTFTPKYRPTNSSKWNVNLQSLYTITGRDPSGSGVEKTEFRIDQGAWVAADAGGFRIDMLPGDHVLWYRSIDRVGNVESEKHLPIFLDTYAPSFSKLPPLYEVDEHWTNFTVVDTGSGVQTVSSFWRVNTGGFQELRLTFNASKKDSGMWVGRLPNFTKGDRLQIYATAVDYLGNAGSWGSAAAPAANFTVGNRRPIVTILEPANNITVSGTVAIRWDITDPDNDPLKVTLFYRPATERAWRLAGNFTDKRGGYNLDTTTLLDGDYEFELSAYDGAFYATQSFELQVRNARPPLEVSPLPEISRRVGETVVISAVVTKKDVVSVKATVLRDGAEVDTIELNDAGRDGDLKAGDRIYAGSYAPESPGDYSARITLKYREESDVKEYQKVVTFSVAYDPVWVLQDNPVLWASIVAFGVGVVGVGAWGITRRWT